jgi:tetratricopeptide (TPR) repeat protein
LLLLSVHELRSPGLGLCEPIADDGSAAQALTTPSAVQRAEKLAGAGREREAREVLRAAVADDPSDVASRLLLIKLLIKGAAPREASSEADRLLERDPDNADGLLAKATAERQSKRLESAIACYRRLLGGSHDADARIGMGYAFLASRQRRLAEDSLASLARPDASRRDEVAALADAIHAARRPIVEIGYEHYADSDDNRSDSVVSIGTLAMRDWDLGADVRYHDARDTGRAQRAEQFMGTAATTWTTPVRLSAGAGLARLGSDRATVLPTGQLGLELTLADSTVKLAGTRNALTTTAELIRHKIALTQTGVSLAQVLSDWWLARATYSYGDYSDANDAHDVQGVLQRRLYAQPFDLAVRYGARYLDFRREAHHGYFDPDHFWSQELGGTWSFDRNLYYASVDVGVGYQSFRRNRIDSNQLFGAGSGTLGVRPTGSLLLELCAEGGNYAPETTNGFKYYAARFRISYAF